MGSAVLFGGAVTLIAAAIHPCPNWWLIGAAIVLIGLGVWAYFRECQARWELELWEFRRAILTFLSSLERVATPDDSLAVAMWLPWPDMPLDKPSCGWLDWIEQKHENNQKLMQVLRLLKRVYTKTDNVLGRDSVLRDGFTTFHEARFTMKFLLDRWGDRLNRWDRVAGDWRCNWFKTFFYENVTSHYWRQILVLAYAEVVLAQRLGTLTVQGERGLWRLKHLDTFARKLYT